MTWGTYDQTPHDITQAYNEDAINLRVVDDNLLVELDMLDIKEVLTDEEGYLVEPAETEWEANREVNMDLSRTIVSGTPRNTSMFI